LKPLRIVVAGTGTDVGKTRFVVEIQRRLRSGGHATLALKPVETGYRADSVEGADATRIGAHNRLRPAPRYAFPEPLSPHVAAELAGSSIDLEAVVPWVISFEDAHHAQNSPPSSGGARAPITLVELAGGLFTPLTLSQVNLDLVRLLEPCRFLLVANDRLGVLHDVLVCTRAAEVFHRAPDLIVFSQHAADHSTSSNRAEFQRLVPTIPACTLGPNLELDLELSWFQS
jgi:dethiobiotin synthetase